MAKHFKDEDQFDDEQWPFDDPDETSDDTSRQWAPMSDEDWAAQDMGFAAEVGYGEDVASRQTSTRRASTRQASSYDPNATVYSAEAQPDAYSDPYVDPYAEQYEDPLTPAKTVVRKRPVDRDAEERAQAAREAQQRSNAAYQARTYTDDQYQGARNYTNQQAAANTTNSAEEKHHKHHRAKAKHGCLSTILWLIMLVVLFFMAIRTLSADQALGQAIPELVSFVPLLFIPIIVCLVLALFWHRRVLAVVCAVSLGVMFWWHAGYFIPTAQVSESAEETVATTASADDSVARVMTLNTCNGEASAEEIVALVEEQNVEILCLQELTSEFVEELEAAGLSELLPYSVISDEASSVSNGGRNGIWTLAPMYNTSTNLLYIETSSMPAASITIGSTTLRIVCVHPNSPVKGAEDLWDEGLSIIGTLSEYDHSYIIMGDFNSTWDHARFRELLGDTFVDAGEQSGEGFHMTYPSSDLIPALIEIDHIVYDSSSGVVVSDLETVAITGTDHYALLGTLEVQ